LGEEEREGRGERETGGEKPEGGEETYREREARAAGRAVATFFLASIMVIVGRGRRAGLKLLLRLWVERRGVGREGGQVLSLLPLYSEVTTRLDSSVCRFLPVAIP
jgi:hypothetical protein